MSHGRVGGTGSLPTLGGRSMKTYERAAISNASGTFSDDECVFTDPGHPEWFLQGLNDLRIAGHFCDVTLCVGNQNFPVHKNVLAAFSSFFKAMFLCNLAESQQEFITLNGVDSDMVSILLNYAYTSTITINSNNVQVLELVRLPLISPYYIADFVEAELAVRSSPECRVLLDEAKTFHLLPDRRSSLNLKRAVPRKNSKTITGIVAVGGEDNTLVLKLVECYDPVGHSWTALAYLPFAVSKHGIVVTGDNLMYLAGGEFVDGTITSSMWRFDPVFNEWSELAPMLVARSELGLAIMDGLIYAVCGWDGMTRINSVECYNPKTNEWKKVAPSCVALMSPSVTSFQGKLYVCGGTMAEGEDGIDLVQAYNPIEDSWDQLPPLLVPRNGAVAAVLNGFIYVIGGYHAGTENTSKVEKYDPRLKEWSFVGSMKERRFQPGVAVLRGKIYVLGGEDGWEHFHNSVEYYDPEPDEWTISGEMMSGRSYLACGLLKIKKNLPKSFDIVGLNRTVSVQEIYGDKQVV